MDRCVFIDAPSNMIVPESAIMRPGGFAHLNGNSSLHVRVLSLVFRYSMELHSFRDPWWVSQHHSGVGSKR